MKRTTTAALIALATLTMVACNNDDPKPDNPSGGGGSGTGTEATVPDALVLNEGGWGANNASISALNIAARTADNEWFSEANGRGLGDVAQDMLHYGSKVYATVTYSNSLEVIDPATGHSQRVDMGTRQPRSLAADGGKLYITCYNPCSVVRVDTATLEVESTCTLGDYKPEGIAIAQGKAFVASSFNDSFEYDNKLYVISLASFASPQTVEVGTNPGLVKSVDDGRVLVCYNGDYATLPAGSAIVDAATLAVQQTGEELAGAAVYGGAVYGYASTWVEVEGNWVQSVGFKKIDLATMTASQLSSLSGIQSPYGIDINPANGDIYVTDAGASANGDIYCYTIDGSMRFKMELGMFPKKTVFLK